MFRKYLFIRLRSRRFRRRGEGTVWTAFPLSIRYCFVRSNSVVLLSSALDGSQIKVGKDLARSDVTFQREEKTIQWPLRCKSRPIGNADFRSFARPQCQAWPHVDLTKSHESRNGEATREDRTSDGRGRGRAVKKKKKKKKNTGVKSATDRNRYPLIAEFVNAFEKLEVSAGDSAERNRK